MCHHPSWNHPSWNHPGRNPCCVCADCDAVSDAAAAAAQVLMSCCLRWPGCVCVCLCAYVQLGRCCQAVLPLEPSTNPGSENFRGRQTHAWHDSKK